MSTWTTKDIAQIAAADDLYISPFREDGVTYGTPTWIWSVVVDGELFVRGYNGPESRWYQAAIQQKAGRIRTAGLTLEVTFETVTGGLHDRIDEAYRKKYDGSPYLSAMISPRGHCAHHPALKENHGIRKTWHDGCYHLAHLPGHDDLWREELETLDIGRRRGAAADSSRD